MPFSGVVRERLNQVLSNGLSSVFKKLGCGVHDPVEKKKGKREKLSQAFETTGRCELSTITVQLAQSVIVHDQKCAEGGKSGKETRICLRFEPPDVQPHAI
jgi:hypothetical protein